jgi:DNA gyrase/topoisomerase IV subunit A
VQRIAELVEAKTLDGIADVRDESDRTGEHCEPSNSLPTGRPSMLLTCM